MPQVWMQPDTGIGDFFMPGLRKRPGILSSGLDSQRYLIVNRTNNKGEIRNSMSKVMLCGRPGCGGCPSVERIDDVVIFMFDDKTVGTMKYVEYEQLPKSLPV